MIIPASRDDWESLSAEELKEYSDTQLKKALQEHFGLRSHVYFMPVSKKRQFILDPDARPRLQKEAEDRQQGHYEKGAAHRGKKPVSELIDEGSVGRQYEFVGVARTNGFTDPFIEREGKIAYVIRDVADGTEFPTRKQTAKVLTELGRLAGFDERISAQKQKPAHAAGLQTLEDVIVHGDEEAAQVAKQVTTPPVEPTDEAPQGADTELDLDAILNSIPQ